MAFVSTMKAPSIGTSLTDYVDDSIAGFIFQAPCDATSHFLVGDRINFPVSATMDDLLCLAHECDRALFGDSSWETMKDGSREAFGEALSGFVKQHEDQSHASFIATLLALNILESTIRETTGYRSGHAPLLKTMIHELPEPRVFELLLTPVGLNMRNLLWHGFLVGIPRCWLSLVLILTRDIVNKRSNKNGIKVEPINRLQAMPDEWIRFSASVDLDTKSRIQDNNACLTSWLPSSHLSLYQTFVKPWIERREYPITCCALLSVLLEHGLRIGWCKANERPHDIARPCEFYVTLDGHGQRQIHDTLLHPYMLGGSVNGLITNDNAATIALLTDLFCSSSGGPNIRASISHGSWDEWLMEEWSNPQRLTEEDPLWRIVEILVFAMESMAANIPIAYQPQYSFTAVTRRSLLRCHSNLKHLIRLREENSLYLEHSEMAQSNLGVDGLTKAIPPDLVALQEHSRILTVKDPLLKSVPTEWNCELLFAEFSLNEKLSNQGLVRSLLEDIAMATHQLSEDIHRALQEYKSVGDRKKKSILRFVYASSLMGIHLYIVAHNVAVFSSNHIDDDDEYNKVLDVKKALQRTRMVVSTTQTMLRDKVDRVRQSILEYSKGKAIRQVFSSITSSQLDE